MSEEKRRQLLRTLLAVEQMVSELSDYFARQELFRQLVVHTPWGDELPKMSLGGLVERLNYLERHRDALTSEEQARLDKARAAYEEAIRYRRQQVAERLRREFRSYLNSWKWYLDELRDNPDKVMDYPAEVHNRLRLTTLLNEARRLGIELDPDQVHMLEELDQFLRSRWQSGNFSLKDFAPEDFSREEHWYLYGRPRL